MRASTSLVIAAALAATACSSPRSAEVPAELAAIPAPSTARTARAVASAVGSASPPAGPAVEMGRVTDLAGGEGSCKVDDDCVVVDGYRQEDLCPPGLSVSRALADEEVRYRLRQGRYRTRPGHCPEAGLAIHPVCKEGTCAAKRRPESEGATNDESLVAAILPVIDACYHATPEEEPQAQLDLTVELLIARNGSVAAVRSDERGPAELRRCVVRAFYGLSFPFIERVRTVQVPLSFRRRSETSSPVRLSGPPSLLP